VENLKKDYRVELVLMENVPHQQALEMKRQCHISVDQLTNLGGWGYGMSSLETLALGIPTVTNIHPEMEDKIAGHPFIHATPDTVERELRRLIGDPEFRRQKGQEGRKWVEKVHDIEVVMDQLCGYYRREGWIS
jgi:glycosyltransferase involved in cell wall biosynthesis